MDKLAVLLLILVLIIPFTMAYADAPTKTVSIQEQILQQITSLLHLKSGISFELSKKQVTEYSLIGAISLIVIIVIASSTRSKNKKLAKK